MNTPTPIVKLPTLAAAFGVLLLVLSLIAGPRSGLAAADARDESLTTTVTADAKALQPQEARFRESNSKCCAGRRALPTRKGR